MEKLLEFFSSSCDPHFSFEIRASKLQLKGPDRRKEKRRGKEREEKEEDESWISVKKIQARHRHSRLMYKK
jgi:hypothetical protein